MDAASCQIPGKKPDCTNASLPVCRPQLPFSYPIWDGSDHESVELSAPADFGAADRCHCRRKYRHPEAKCLRSCLTCHDQRNHRNHFPGRLYFRHWGRTYRKSGIAPPEVWQDLFYRKQGCRKGSSAACRRESDPCYIGTGWKKSLYRWLHRKNPTCCQTYCFWKIFKLRTDLRCTRLYPVPSFGPAKIGCCDPAWDPDSVWRESVTEPGLWQDHQCKAFSATFRTPWSWKDRLWREHRCGNSSYWTYCYGRCYLGRCCYGRRNLRTAPSDSDLWHFGGSNPYCRITSTSAGSLFFQWR